MGWILRRECFCTPQARQRLALASTTHSRLGWGRFFNAASWCSWHMSLALVGNYRVVDPTAVGDGVTIRAGGDRGAVRGAARGDEAWHVARVARSLHLLPLCRSVALDIDFHTNSLARTKCMGDADIDFRITMQGLGGRSCVQAAGGRAGSPNDGVAQCILRPGIHAPPCEVHTVCITRRVLQGYRDKGRSYADTSPCRIHALHVRRVLQGGVRACVNGNAPPRRIGITSSTSRVSCMRWRR